MLKEILDSQDLPLTHGRSVGIKQIASQLGVGDGVLRTTPCLSVLVERKQREIDLSLRQGKTKRTFTIGGVPHVNIGATPWSPEHQRAFDFSALIEPYGLKYAEKIGTAFYPGSHEAEIPESLLQQVAAFS